MKLTWGNTSETKSETKTESEFKGGKATQTRTNSIKRGYELDFTTLALVIILVIIAYELLGKNLAVPMFVWYLVGLILVLVAIERIITGILALMMYRNIKTQVVG
jgi:hypothetical protein